MHPFESEAGYRLSGDRGTPLGLKAELIKKDYERAGVHAESVMGLGVAASEPRGSVVPESLDEAVELYKAGASEVAPAGYFAPAKGGFLRREDVEFLYGPGPSPAK